MLQDGSLPLNRRLPAASYLPPRVAACRSFVPPYRHTSPSPRPPPQPPPASAPALSPSRRRLRLRQRFPSVQSSSICHMPTQLRPSLFPLPLFLSRYENLTARRPRQLAGILKRSRDRLMRDTRVGRARQSRRIREIAFDSRSINDRAYRMRTYSRLHREMRMRANLQTTLSIDRSRLMGKE